MSEISTRTYNRIKKDNEILFDRADRYMKEIKVYKEFNEKLVKENLKLEEEILTLRRILKAYENRKNWD